MTIPRQTPIHDKRSAQATTTAASPHDAKGKALALCEPLVNEDEDRVVQKAAANGVEDALGQDQVPNRRGEGRERDGDNDDGETERRASPAYLWPALENSEQEGRGEVHDALVQSALYSSEIIPH